MSNGELDQEADLGIQAFQDMGRSMDRLRDKLRTADNQHDAKVRSQENAALRIGDATAKASHAADIALNASQNALQAAKTEIRSSLLWVGLFAALAVLLGVLLGYFVGHSSGWDAGEASGYATAKDQIAAAAWANTPNGQRALAMDRIGSLSTVTACSGPGWYIQRQDGRQVCYPANDPKGAMTGWFLQ